MLKKIEQLFNREGNSKYLPGIAWFFLTLLAISIPGKDLPKFGPWYHYISFDKLIHTFLFGMLAVLFMLPVKYQNLSVVKTKQQYIKIALAAAIWGFTAEVIQKYFIPGRSYDLVDVLANTLGAVTAYIIFSRWLRKMNNNRA